MDEMKKLLSDEIETEFHGLGSVEQGTEEHARAVEDLNKLCKILMDSEKSETECKQSADEKLSRYLKLGVEIAGIILPLMFYGAWMHKGFEFEKTGIITSTTFKNLISRFRPTGK